MASWSNRAEISHTLIADKSEDYQGELARYGDEESGEVLDLLTYTLGDADGDIDTALEGLAEDYRLFSVFQSFGEPEQEEILRVAQLIHEATDDSFAVLDQGPDLDLNIQSEDDLKGLEAIVEGLEDLGFSVALTDYEH